MVSLPTTLEKLDINAIPQEQGGRCRATTGRMPTRFDYNPELDQIIFSSNYLSEVFIIDHSTTPFEAQGSAGGRSWQGWRLPVSLGQFGELWPRGTEETVSNCSPSTTSHWIDPGLSGCRQHHGCYNNGQQSRRVRNTTVVEIAPPLNEDGSYNLGEDGTYDATEVVWEYAPTDDEQFFSFFISGAQRLPNGNTLVNKGAGGQGSGSDTPDGDIVWEYFYRRR